MGGLLEAGRVGRYVVFEEIGRGGMGRVSRAYDPKLEREVALKEVRGELLGKEGTQRLVAEARAMARLSHPNVVAVYDVEELEHGRLVLVMEYVAGQTLRSWLRGKERPWRSIVGHFIGAGRGLAAAHAVGLLHRDFKLSNVLIGSDGAVKVTDFGLAKSAGDGISSAGHGPGSPTTNEELTQPGVVMGTERYMAPEQHRGEELTGAADQFAFCVALWEALCREPPYQSDLSARKSDGPPKWPTREQKNVPRPIAEAVSRGLCADAGDRWPSMTALLEALSYDPAKRRNQWLMVVGGIGVAGLAVTSRQSWLDAESRRCSGADAQLSGVWDESRRTEVQAAIVGIGASYADRVWERSSQQLDQYAIDWAAAHTDACEATSVRAEQSTEVMDLRMGCLRRAKVHFEAVVRVLADADVEVVQNAHALLGELTPLSRCADTAALRADQEPPLPHEAEAVDVVRALLARAKVEREAGHYPAAQATVADARERLATVDYGPVHTEVALVQASVWETLGDYKAAESTLQEALELASRWRQWDEMQEAASMLVYVVGAQQQRPEQGLRYHELARELANGDPEREARALSNFAAVLKVQGKYAEAEEVNRQALALLERALGSTHPSVAMVRNNIATILDAQGKYAEAETEHRETLKLREKVLGPDHPHVATSLSNLGGALWGQAKYAEAEAVLQRTIEVHERALGPAHPTVAQSRHNYATVLHTQGKYAEAETEYRRALEVWETALGPEHPDAVAPRTNLAGLLYAQRKFAEAEAEVRHVLVVREKALGPEHPDVARARDNLANILRELGKLGEAETEFRRAVAIGESALGAEHPQVAASRNNLALVLHARRKYAEAEVEFRSALKLRHKLLGDDHPDVATSRHNLAALLYDQGRAADAIELAEDAWRRRQLEDIPIERQADTAALLSGMLWKTRTGERPRTRSRELAERALAGYTKAGDGYADDVAEVRTWLRQHSAPPSRRSD